MAEFGVSLVNEVDAEIAGNEIVTPDPDILSGTTGSEVESEAFQSRLHGAAIMEA